MQKILYAIRSKSLLLYAELQLLKGPSLFKIYGKFLIIDIII